MKQSDIRYHADNSGGAFLSGLTVGLFAGAAGYFLFGTERGAKLRKDLEAEWMKAQSQLYQEGLIDNPEVSLRDFLRTMVEKMAKNDHPLTGLVTELSTSRKTRVRKPAGKRFRGT